VATRDGGADGTIRGSRRASASALSRPVSTARGAAARDAVEGTVGGAGVGSGAGSREAAIVVGTGTSIGTGVSVAAVCPVAAGMAVSGRPGDPACIVRSRVATMSGANSAGQVPPDPRIRMRGGISTGAVFSVRRAMVAKYAAVAIGYATAPAS
jgi:hypothetical protein